MTDAEKIAALTQQISDLSKKNDALSAAASAGTPSPPPESDDIRALRALVAEVAQKVEETAARTSAGTTNTSSFVPPINSAGTGTSPSLRSLFPNVEAAHITAIITHDFRGADLYKLDSRYRDKETAYTFNGTTGQFESSNRAAKDYKSYDALYLPLVTYFSILSAHLPNQRTIPFVFFQFLIHLQKITRDYEWNAVLEYTMIFFNRRRMEMLESGDYSHWAMPDAGLMAEHVFAHKKSVVKASGSSKSMSSSPRTPIVCNNWNSGKCSGTAKCPSNRTHACSSCGKSDHTLLDHPKGT